MEGLISRIQGRAWELMEGPLGLYSEALAGSYENDYPDRKPPSDRALRKYWKDVFSPSEIRSVHEMLSERLRSGEGLRVWRSVKVPGDPVEGILAHARANGLGIYWSWDRDAAHPHDAAGVDAPSYVIEAVVGQDDLDWIDTLAACVVPDWAGECEVRLLPEARIGVLSLVRRDGWLHRLEGSPEAEVDLSSLAGAVFSAGYGHDPLLGAETAVETSFSP